MDAKVSAAALESIFWPSSPLHDLAVIIRGERIAAASVQLPLTEETGRQRLGARHRAAVGVTEECDALVVVVSEENGSIRIAENGRLSQPVPQAEFADLLRSKLSRPRRRGQQSVIGAVVGTLGGVDAPALPTPGIDEPAPSPSPEASPAAPELVVGDETEDGGLERKTA
jgi:diadenylate cyclase